MEVIPFGGASGFFHRMEGVNGRRRIEVVLQNRAPRERAEMKMVFAMR